MKTTNLIHRYLLTAISALAFLIVGCSTDSGSISPVASTQDPSEMEVQDPCDLGPEYCYPPLTEEQLTNGPAPGWSILRRTSSVRDNDGGLDDQPDVVVRLIRQNQNGVLTLQQNQITIPQGALPVSELTVSMAVPEDGIAMVDFGPHGTQFNSPVTIRLDFEDFELPEGLTGEDLAIWYINDDGELELFNGTVTNNGNWLETTTNHFSRYIIAVRTLY